MKISLKKVFKDSWINFKSNYKFLVPFFLLILVVSAGLTFLSGDKMFSLTGIVSLLVYPVLYYGVTNVSLRVIENKKIGSKNVLEGFNQKIYLSFLVISILMSLAVFVLTMAITLTAIVLASISPLLGSLIGLFLALFAFIYFIGVIFFPSYRLVDMRAGFKDALKHSFNASKGRRLFLLKFFLAIFLLNIIGLILIGIGLLVTIPMSSLAIAHVYYSLKTKVN